MKRKITFTLATLMAMSALTTGALADEYTKANLTIEGKAVVTDQSPVIVSGRTMVPVRVVAESLGTTVDWNAETKTVSFENEGLKASMVIGDKKLLVSGSTVEIDVPATIINNRTMVPVRFLSETFGYNVEWDAETKTVNVTANKAESSVTDETPAASADVEALKAAALVVDGYAGVLNDYTDKMTEEQAKAYAEYCDNNATVLAMVDNKSRKSKSEIEEGAKAVAAAKAGMEEIAKALNVELSKTSADVESLKAEALIVDGYAGVLNDYTDKMTEEQAKAYAEYCDNNATVLAMVDNKSEKERF
ncbi:MAG: copper amine oxidase N-terminal domain-containing protein [Lachnospirales bacterium]